MAKSESNEIYVPHFLDFEASSLGISSWPIEVAWTLSDGSIEQHLISPEGIDEWTDWSSDAERMHGISHDELLRSGEDPSSICARMNQTIAEVAYSDSPSHDGMWLTELFATHHERPRFRLAHAHELLRECALAAAARGCAVDLREAQRQASQTIPRRHRAAYDVQFLLELWRLVTQ